MCPKLRTVFAICYMLDLPLIGVFLHYVHNSFGLALILGVDDT